MNPKANKIKNAEFPEVNSQMIMPTIIRRKFLMAFGFLFLSPLIPDTRKYAVMINPTQLKNVAKIKPPIFYLFCDSFLL